MKRALSLMLAVLLALSVCGGCTKKESPESSAPATSLPTVETASASAAEAASPAELPGPEAAGDPAETSFPGGLDDDGPGPGEEDPYEPEEGAPGHMSGLNPVEFFPLDGSKQYEANIFLSNFAEQGINLYFYDLDMSQILPSLVRFAHIWCKINDRSSITYGQVDGVTYEILTFDRFRSVIGRFIPLNVTEESAEQSYPPQDHSFYRDGKFYFEAADGEAHNGIAVADTLARLDDGRYVLTFTEYEIDLDAYYSFDFGIPRAYYELDPLSASQHQYLTRIRDGYAIVTPYQYNGRDTYQLVEYTTW